MLNQKVLSLTKPKGIKRNPSAIILQVHSRLTLSLTRIYGGGQVHYVGSTTQTYATFQTFWLSKFFIIKSFLYLLIDHMKILWYVQNFKITLNIVSSKNGSKKKDNKGAFFRIHSVIVIIFIIQGFQTIAFTFILIFTTFHPMSHSAFFRYYLSNSGAYTELWTTTFI